MKNLAAEAGTTAQLRLTPFEYASEEQSIVFT